ncbi:MAG: hypothetical protein LBO72_01495, partial [Helicobacteraceae bacterium]|nr:hypothetical protein [Helicobacteraceae bacterium]
SAAPFCLLMAMIAIRAYSLAFVNSINPSFVASCSTRQCVTAFARRLRDFATFWRAQRFQIVVL